MRKLNQKGQGTIEYILVFMVVMLIAGGLFFQFTDAFKNFVNGYFGDYLACLLESAELPSLGWDGPGQDCNGEFTPFNLATGRNPIKNGTGAVSGFSSIIDPAKPQTYKSVDGFSVHGPTGGTYNPGNPGSHGPNGGALSEGNVKGFSVSGPGGPGGAGGFGAGGAGGVGAGGAAMGDGTGAGSLSNFGGSGRGGRSGGKTFGLSKSEKAETSKSSDSTGGDIVGVAYHGRKGTGRDKYVAITGEQFFQQQEEQKEIQRKTTSAAVSELEAEAAAKHVTVAELKRMKAQGDIETKLQFSDFLKYIVIAGIVIAILLLLGGQALQISKSQEK